MKVGDKFIYTGTDKNVLAGNPWVVVEKMHIDFGDIHTTRVKFEPINKINIISIEVPIERAKKEYVKISVMETE